MQVPKSASALGSVPAANGEPGTAVNAPLAELTAKAEMSLLPSLPTNTYFLSLVPTIAWGDVPVATGVPTAASAPLVASTVYAETVLSPALATEENCEHTTATSVTFAACTLIRPLLTTQS